jgi:hypothetical protein
MINIAINKDFFLQIDALKEKFSDKQVRFATSRAINQAAYVGAQATVKEMRKVFDRPTPWILKSVRYTKSTKDNLKAEIDFDFWGNKQGVTASQVLQAEIFGGQRNLKRHEKALQRSQTLPKNKSIVPGANARTDKYGNMSAGQIVQVMAWFNSFGQQGYEANINAKGRKRLGRDKKKTGQKGFQYFALKAKRGKLLPGVYQRFQTGFGSAVKPVMIFVDRPKYKARLDFYGIAEKEVRKEINNKIAQYYADAVRTAK